LSTKDAAETSPFIEPFKGTGIPIIYSYINIDEMIFTTIGNYKGMKFVNVEGDFKEISEDINKFKKDTKKDEKKPESSASSAAHKISADEITPFCLWIKNEL